MVNEMAFSKTRIRLTFLSTLIILCLNVTGQNTPSHQILSITDKLQKEDVVHFGYAVGYAARPETNNKYYKLYKRLKAIATDEELVALTNGHSKIITVYAFNILHSRKYSGLKEIFYSHVNDTAWFWTAGGCTGIVDRVNWFMLRMLKPTNDTTNTFLTKEEYDLYCSRFKKEDKEFTCY
jgi:hypothetical protein